MKKVFILSHSEARRRAAQHCMEAPEGQSVVFSDPNRSTAQNACLWSLLSEISEQVVWHGRKLDSESWKHIFSSSLKKQDVVPNLDNTGFVVLGQSTSRMTKFEMSEMLELITAFALQQCVKLKAPEYET